MTNKKGTGTRPAPQTQTNNTKLQNTCLFLFILFLIIFCTGKALDVPELTFFSLGIGAAVSIIIAIDLTKKGENNNE